MLEQILLVALAAPGNDHLYGLSTGSSPNHLGEIVTIDPRDGTTHVVGALSDHAPFSCPADVVLSADGRKYFAIEWEIGDGWARSHLVSADARTLKIERSVLLGEAFNALTLDASGRLLAARLDQEGSSLVALDAQTGASTLIGRQGREWQFLSLSLERASGKLAGLSVVMPGMKKYAVARLDPATGRVESSAELQITEKPQALAAWSGGLALVVTDEHSLFEVELATGRAKRRATIGKVNLVGLHAQP